MRTIYRRKDSEIGSRFAVERCFDEAQLRELMLRVEDEKRRFDQSRSICSNPAICAPE
jgi:hypothetical protein